MIRNYYFEMSCDDADSIGFDRTVELLVNVFKLRVAVPMLRPLARLAVGLQAVTSPFEQRRDRAIRDGMPLPYQLRRQHGDALAGPPPQRFRMIASDRIDQRFERRQQGRDRSE